MAVNLAEILSRNYEIPLEQYPAQQARAPRGGRGTGGGQGMEFPEFEDEIQVVQGMSRDYYTKIANLKAFAHQMQAMGIDVMKPDPLDPRSVQANNLFNKGMADIQNQGNAMAYYREQLEADRQKARDVKDYNMYGDTSQSLYDPDRHVVDSRITDRVTEANKYAKSYGTRSETEQANALIMQQEDEIMREYNAAQEAGDTRRVKELQSELFKIRRAMYDPMEQMKLNESRAARAQADAPDKATAINLDIADAQAGKEVALDASRFRNDAGEQLYDVVRHNATNGTIELISPPNKDGEVKTEIISLRDDDGGWEKLYQLFSRAGYKVSKDDALGLNRKLLALQPESDQPLAKDTTYMSANAFVEDFQKNPEKAEEMQSFIDEAIAEGNISIPAGSYGEHKRLPEGTKVTGMKLKPSKGSNILGFGGRGSEVEISIENPEGGEDLVFTLILSNKKGEELTEDNAKDVATFQKILYKNTEQPNDTKQGRKYFNFNNYSGNASSALNF